MNTLTKVVTRAIGTAPCTVRALAREAGVSHSLLLLIVKGDRTVTPAVADKLAAALDRWGARCAEAADAIRKARTPRKGAAR